MPAPPAFRPDMILVRPDQLVARKQLSPTLRNSVKYRQIRASLQNVGLIEPIVVFPAGHAGPDAVECGAERCSEIYPAVRPPARERPPCRAARAVLGFEQESRPRSHILAKRSVSRQHDR